MARMLLLTLLCLLLSAPTLASSGSSSKPAVPAKGANEGSKIDVNTASVAELTKLNGVGEVTAKKIVEYREANGPFKSIDDLGKVKGIGPKTLDKFRDQVSLGGTEVPGAPPSEAPTAPAKAAEGAQGEGAQGGVRININAASVAELTKLPGVGETTAKRIVEYRSANGPFKSCQELNQIKGVGEKTLQKIEGACAVK
jgi:competence protein ComEA